MRWRIHQAHQYNVIVCKNDSPALSVLQLHQWTEGSQQQEAKQNDKSSVRWALLFAITQVVRQSPWRKLGHEQYTSRHCRNHIQRLTDACGIKEVKRVETISSRHIGISCSFSSRDATVARFQAGVSLTLSAQGLRKLHYRFKGVYFAVTSTDKED